VERKKKNLFKDFLVIIIAAIYFLIATTHIFYLPNTVRSGRKIHKTDNSTFKRTPETFYIEVSNLNFIRLIDKSTLEDKRIIKDLIQSIAKYLFVLSFTALIWWLKPKRLTNRLRQLINYHGYYLSICTLKI
jgi:hypothetical protein